jgi:hypothetical protein
MNTIQLLIIFCIIIGLSNWYIYYETIKQLKINKNYKYDDTIINIINKQIQEAKINEIPKNNNNYNNKDNNNKDKDKDKYNDNDKDNDNNKDNNNDRLFKRDMDVKYNVFYPPERRYTFLYNNNQPYILEKKSYNNHINYRQPEDVYYNPTTINIPSRGYPDNYQIMGVLIEDNKASAYNIFGRKTFPGSNEYEYYIQGKINNTDIKYPLKIKKELEDNKELNIPELGIFKIKVYDYDSPKYIPY